MGETSLTAFERIEVQMRYVVPLLRGLQQELGEAAVSDALRAVLDRRVAAARARAKPKVAIAPIAEPLADGFLSFAEGEVLDYELIATDRDELAIDVSDCGYARLMNELDATDLGHLLLCSEDEVLAAVAGVELVRTGTRMQGASRCDFRFRPAAYAQGETA